MKNPSLYIETHIACPVDVLWEYTQNPAIHQQWDLRFTSITYLPKTDDNEPQQFLYTTQIGFGLKINGKGESAGTKSKQNGESTSVLKFWSDEKLSLIETGSGYWKYIPAENGVKFITGYDYTTRNGLAGKIIDKLFFRPLIGWATALSFDTLKLWIEQSIHPKSAFRNFSALLVARAGLAIIWFYMGLVPKLLFPETGELAMTKNVSLFSGIELATVTAIGILEILFGLGFLILVRNKTIHYINIFILVVLGSFGIAGTPVIAVQPFNPVTLSLAMVALSVITLIYLKQTPSAYNCQRKPAKK